MQIKQTNEKKTDKLTKQTHRQNEKQRKEAKKKKLKLEKKISKPGNFTASSSKRIPTNLVSMDSAQSLLSKYIEIIVRKPPSPDFLAPKAGESMKGTSEIESKIYMIFTESVTLMFDEGGCAAVTPHRGLRPPTPAMELKESSTYPRQERAHVRHA